MLLWGSSISLYSACYDLCILPHPLPVLHVWLMGCSVGTKACVSVIPMEYHCIHLSMACNKACIRAWDQYWAIGAYEHNITVFSHDEHGVIEQVCNSIVHMTLARHSLLMTKTTTRARCDPAVSMLCYSIKLWLTVLNDQSCYCAGYAVLSSAAIQSCYHTAVSFMQ